MSDRTIDLLERMRGYALPSARAKARALDAFMRLIAGDAERSHGKVASLLAGQHGRAEAFRLAYETALPHASRATAAGPGGLVLEGLPALDPEQRALLSLSCVLGLSDGELAHVLGLPAAAVAARLDAAIAAARAAAGTRRATDAA